MATPDEQKAADEKKAADARVAESAKAESNERAKVPIHVVGVAGGPFSITGSGFGSSRGSLTIGGVAVQSTRWDDSQIRGILPHGVKGPIVLTPAGGEVRNGVFPTPPPPPAK